MTKISLQEWVKEYDRGDDGDRRGIPEPTQKGFLYFMEGRAEYTRQQLRWAYKEYYGIKPRAYKSRKKADPIVQASLDLSAKETALDPPPAPVKPLYGGRIESPDEFRRRLDGNVFVFTAAQNNTAVHSKFFDSLLTYCQARNAQLGIAKISYNKNGWQKITKDSDEVNGEEIWYAPELEPYFITEQVKVADNLLFCGELDILPTAVYPLNGLQNYTGHNSAIVPHTKMQMQSLATMKDEVAKFLYSTGAVTMRNYIQRRAGQIAEYHHVYGAVVVEIDTDGVWFVRQINADEDGIFHELNHVYGPDFVAPAKNYGRPIINLGDIHEEKSDPVAMDGAVAMMNELDPEEIIVHDLIDFEHRNHHNIKDPFFLAAQYHNRSTVESNIEQGAEFLIGMATLFENSKIVSVRSNHDQAITTWLKNTAGATDPGNARYWHQLNYQMLAAIELGEEPDPFGQAMEDKLSSDEYLGFFEQRKRITLLKEDESYVRHNIEFGMHGHLGPNGARGNPKAFRQIGKRANTGHTHSAGIVDGIYTAGVLARLDMGYNKGPSSWSQSHILTYSNGKRTIITQRGSKWRA